MAEKDFKSWYQEKAKLFKLNPNPDDPKHYYDYRAAHKAGVNPDPKSGHWPSQFKKVGHPNLIIKGIDTRTGKPPTPSLIETLKQMGKPK